MKIHRFGPLRDLAKTRGMARNRKFVAMVGAFALLVLGGVGLLLRNTTAISSYVWYRDGRDLTIATYMQLPDVVSIYNEGNGYVTLQPSCYREAYDAATYTSSVVISAECLEQFDAGGHDVVMTWRNSSGASVANYDLTIIDVIASHTWQKGSSAGLTIANVYDYATHRIYSVSVDGATVDSSNWSTSSDGSVSLEASYLENLEVGQHTLYILGYYGNSLAWGGAYTLMINEASSTVGPTIAPSSSVYNNGGSTGITFTPATSMTAPSAVTVDGADLTLGTHYTVDSTTGAVTILPAYLDTLENGRHTVAIKWADGTVSTAVLVTAGKYSDEGPTAVAPYTYTVKFDKNTTDAVTGVPSDLTYETLDRNYTFTLPTTAPVRDGYVFKGWGVTTDATTAVSEVELSYTERTVTVYAIWEVASNDENGGSSDTGGTGTGGTEAGDNNASNGPALAVPDTGANAEKTDGVAGITLASVGVVAVVAIVFAIIRQKHHAVGFTKK